jgi:phage portal protein BeeE
MPGLIHHWRNWRKDRLQKKLARYAPPKPPEPTQQLTNGERQALHRFSAPTWDDVEQRFTMLGPMMPVMNVALQDDDIDRLLRASAWSWASINGNSKAMAQLSPIVQERVGGDWQTAPDAHPLNAFLADPLGTDPQFPFWSWMHLFYVVALHYYSVGNSYLLPIDTMGGDLSVMPILHPDKMTADDDNELEVPTLYRYKRDRYPERTWKPDEIVNIMAPGASSYWNGASPLRAALRSTEIDQVAAERQRYNLRNRISPGPVISFDMPLGPTPEQRIEVKKELIADYSDVTDTGLPLVMGSAGKIDRGFNAEELQVFETRRSAREDIIAVIGTQPSVMGQLDNATYSNTKEATVLWFDTSIGPVAELVYEQLNAQLVRPRYDSSTRIWYSLAGSQIGMQLLNAKLDVATKLQGLGYTTNDIDRHLQMGMGPRDYLDRSTGADVTAGRSDPIETTEEPEEQPEPIAAAD